MEYDNNYRNRDRDNGVYSKRIRAGRRRTYFFDVRTTRANDFYLTITESKRRFDDNGYDRHKLHLYKEDFNKFIDALQDTIDHVKTELLPEYDFDEFTRNDDRYGYENNNNNNNNNNGYQNSGNNEVPKEEKSDFKAPVYDDDDDDLKWDAD